MSKLDVRDAAFHFLRAEVGSSDMFGIYVFDSGDGRAPTFEEIRAHVQGRARRIPSLNVVLREAPFNLDYPSWVPGDSSFEENISDHDLGGASWDDCQRLVATFLESSVDARVRPWHLHVVRGVHAVPTVVGSATVAVLQVTHALTDGLGLTRVAGALFAPASSLGDAIAADIAVDATTPRPLHRLLGAGLAVGTIPVRLAKYAVATRVARRRYQARNADAGSAVRPGAAIRFTSQPTGTRAIRIVPLPASTFRGTGVPVTSVALSSVASAMSRYLLAHGDPAPEMLAASVPVALRADAEWSSANRVLSGIVDLHVDTQNPTTRAAEISNSLAAARLRVNSPELIAVARTEEHLPAPVVLANRRWHNRRAQSTPHMVLSHTNVVSVDRGPAALVLCGSSVAFTSGAPMLTSGRSVVHGFFGVGDVITVVVVACPDTMPDHEFYTDLLLTAIQESATGAAAPTDESSTARESKP